MRIHLIRHGQSTANRDKIYQGQMDTELSELGKSQARELRDYLPNNVDAIYASPLKRALDTAKISTENLDTEIIIKDGLREMDLGIMEGVLKNNITPEQKEIWKKVNTDDSFEGHKGETGIAMIDRVKQVFDEIVQRGLKEDYSEILVFTHYGVLRAIFTRILEFELENYQNAELYTLETTDGTNWKYYSRNQ